MSWDERYQWKGNGYTNYNYIVHGDKETLLASADKYHGPAFELVLVVIEKATNLNDVRDVFLMRHLLCFLVFYLSSVFFWFLSLRIFKSSKAAFLGVLMYVLSPHIFSHSFYNSKDTVFLSFFVISIFCLIRFFEDRSFRSAIVLALITAFTIDIRIIGVLIPAFLFYLLTMECIRERKLMWKENWRYFIVFALLLIPFIILFWPVLWIDPIVHFKAALKENSNFPWDAPVLYFGKQFRPTTLPWHYLYFWTFISRPVLYSLFFLTGIAVVFKRLMSAPLKFIKQELYVQVVLFWFFLPLLAMLLFKSPAFDTGRHLYFLHGGFVLLSVYGARSLWGVMQGKKLLLVAYVGLLSVLFLFLLFNLIKLHPYEHLYFNETKMQSMEKQKRDFEFDYWGLSSKEALEKLLQMDTSKQIFIQAENLPGELNAWLLKPEERARLKFTKNLEGATYFLADYRWRQEEDYQYKREVLSTMIGDTKANTIFRVLNSRTVFNLPGAKLLSFQNDFETNKTEWKGNNIIKPDSAHSGMQCTEVDKNKTISESLEITDVSSLAGNGRLMVKTTFWVYDVEPGSSSKFAIGFENKDGQPYFWYGIAELKNEYRQRYPKWKKIDAAMQLPVLRSKDDKIKLYLMNMSGTRILLDDVEVSFEEEITECKTN